MLSFQDRTTLQDALSESQPFATNVWRRQFVFNGLAGFPNSNKITPIFRYINFDAAPGNVAQQVLEFLDGQEVAPGIPACAFLAEIIEPWAGPHRHRVKDLRRRMGWGDIDREALKFLPTHPATAETFAVLIVFANPRGTNPISLGKEDRIITESIHKSKLRDKIELVRLHASTIDDLARELLNGEFRIVHISGHGVESGLVLEGDHGNSFLVPPDALAKNFARYAPPRGKLECVILNACYSVSTGTLTSQGVPFTIAVEGKVDDEAAIEFSLGFYDAIGAAKDIQSAYEEGCNRVTLKKPGALFVSKLLRLGESETDPPSSAAHA